MKAEEIAAALHPMEIKVIEACHDKKTFSDREIVSSGAVTEAQMRTVIQWQLAKECMEVVETEEKKWVELTELGESYLNGTPKQRLIERVQQTKTAKVSELTTLKGLSQREAGTALGALKKASILVDAGPGEVTIAEGADLDPIMAMAELIKKVGEVKKCALDQLPEADIERIEGGSRKRGKSKGIFKLSTTSSTTLQLTSLGQDVYQAIKKLGRSGDEVNLLTAEMLADGSWKGRSFRRYSMDIRPPRRVAGRRHPYREFLDYVRGKLVGLGFEEMRGGLVENEFWNMDALFMPQFHAARDIHDAYFIRQPKESPPIAEPYASKVAAAHTDGGETGSCGWGYEFDHQRSRRLLLRSQGTVLSARWLKKAKVPGKYFGIARCFRPDEVDATHAADFFQCEGIVLGQQIDFVTLLGLLKLFALEVAKAKEIKFCPAYFPFTEPSVEIHILHPKVGWMELGGAGIFRPEVTWPQGVEVPVIAWGLGLDRMAMMALGLDDIRDLFSQDLSKVRSTRINMKD
jgi:phenylalanyl-tRNA synthetase alpha chain